ncbi:hypothetical protein FXO38_08445 [Capsicum annuum]|nr:hypothetical protein FXO38_08445 [Capsicum annuum]
MDPIAIPLVQIYIDGLLEETIIQQKVFGRIPIREGGGEGHITSQTLFKRKHMEDLGRVLIASTTTSIETSDNRIMRRVVLTVVVLLDGVCGVCGHGGGGDGRRGGMGGGYWWHLLVMFAVALVGGVCGGCRWCRIVYGLLKCKIKYVGDDKDLEEGGKKMDEIWINYYGILICFGLQKFATVMGLRCDRLEEPSIAKGTPRKRSKERNKTNKRHVDTMADPMVELIKKELAGATAIRRAVRQGQPNIEAFHDQPTEAKMGASSGRVVGVGGRHAYVDTTHDDKYVDAQGKINMFENTPLTGLDAKEKRDLRWAKNAKRGTPDDPTPPFPRKNSRL